MCLYYYNSYQLAPLVAKRLVHHLDRWSDWLKDYPMTYGVILTTSVDHASYAETTSLVQHALYNHIWSDDSQTSI